MQVDFFFLWPSSVQKINCCINPPISSKSSDKQVKTKLNYRSNTAKIKVTTGIAFALADDTVDEVCLTPIANMLRTNVALKFSYMKLVHTN
jgi:hypothetical protein